MARVFNCSTPTARMQPRSSFQPSSSPTTWPSKSLEDTIKLRFVIE
jgi:hypothetical protein